MNINISFTGLDSSDALKVYLNEKLEKHAILFTGVKNIDVVFKSNIHAKGVDKDFKLDINIYLPRAVVRVEESGSDMYAIIDKATDVVARRLKRYAEKKSNWEGKTPWRVLEADEALNALNEEEGVVDSYEGYIPKITIKKKVEDMTPMSEGEAIEKMELLGEKQLLFKNKSTNKISMIYARDDGGYGLVEPANTPFAWVFNK
ncbi:MAG TPA: ribosome-associated translation inhibitor RaiA [Candidatus Dojkabacteria bacterium]|nr:ribosome-associated translation inhibitor RaiA [Candidatus Dojkabacteria bacterium]